MPGLFTRSKSLRMLRGNRKDAHQEEIQNPIPLPNSFKTDLDRYKSAVPVATTVRKPETPNVGPRPRTSNGPGDRTPLFHKKTTPVPSIYSQEHIQSLPSLTSPTVVFPSAESAVGQEHNTGIIGIALGSPTRGSHWNIATPQSLESNPQSSDADTQMGFHRAKTTPSANGSQGPLKSKLSRWKSLFRRTPRPPTKQDKKSFYQVAKAASTDRTDSHHDNKLPDLQVQEKQKEEIDALLPPTSKPEIREPHKAQVENFAPPEPPQLRQRAWTVGANSIDPRRTRIKRASTAPSLPTQGMTQDLPIVLQVAETTTVKSPLGNPLPHCPTVPKVVVMSSPQIMTVGASPSIPLLDISIPDVKLERYSAMFENVLQQPPNRTASLLERRQGNAEKIRTLNKLSINQGANEESLTDHPLKRRATSPGLVFPSPKLSLFPSTNSGRPLSPRPASRNRQKSRTAAANSPLSQTLPCTLSQGNHTPEPLTPSASPYLNAQRSALTPGSEHSLESNTEAISVKANIAVGEDGKSRNIRLENGTESEILPRPLMAEPLNIAKCEVPTQTAELVESQKHEPMPAQTPDTQENEEPLVIQTLSRFASQRQPRVTKLSALSSHPSSTQLDIPSSPLENLQTLLSPPLTTDGTHDKLQGRTTLGIARSVSMSRKVESNATVGIARSVSVSRASPRPTLRTAATFGTESPQRLVPRQTLMPTIVDVGNRRSQRVTLVDV